MSHCGRRWDVDVSEAVKTPHETCKQQQHTVLGAALGANVSVGTLTVHAGEKATGPLQILAGADPGISLPVIVIHGARPGPILGLISGSHGTQYALSKLAQHIDPEVYVSQSNHSLARPQPMGKRPARLRTWRNS